MNERQLDLPVVVSRVADDLPGRGDGRRYTSLTWISVTPFQRDQLLMRLGAESTGAEGASRVCHFGETKMMSTPRLAAAAVATLLCGSALSASTPQSQTFTIDCAKGQTISAALERGDAGKPLVLIIRGTCNENVAINRDDVTLQGDPTNGVTINGSSVASTITVRASRVRIDRITVRGGNPNGIALIGGSNIEISNSDVQNALGQGINVTGTSAVNVTNSAVQHNTRAGIGVSQASIAIADSQISHNSGAGVIGVWDASISIANSEIASNATSGLRAIRHSSVTLTASTISSNAQLGVELRTSEANINGTTITANGTGGISAAASSFQVNGSTIANNLGAGVSASGPGFVALGSSSVTGNGGSNGGVSFYLGATGTIDGGSISANSGAGVWVWVNSTVQVAGGAAINNNAGHGIQLNADSKLWVNGPATVGGNGGFGVNCMDTASSAFNLSSVTYVPNNGAGTTNCR